MRATFLTRGCERGCSGYARSGPSHHIPKVLIPAPTQRLRRRLLVRQHFGLLIRKLCEAYRLSTPRVLIIMQTDSLATWREKRAGLSTIGQDLSGVV